MVMDRNKKVQANVPVLMDGRVTIAQNCIVQKDANMATVQQSTTFIQHAFVTKVGPMIHVLCLNVQHLYHLAYQAVSMVIVQRHN